jgi:NAD+ diphosphatase
MSLPPRVNAFANSPLDRAGHRRKEEAYLASAIVDEQARVAILQAGQVLCDGAGVVWLNGSAASLSAPSLPLTFLGQSASEHPYFAVCLPERAELETLPIAGLGEMVDMRTAATRLAGDELAIVGAAKALFEWHARHRFCAACGEASEIAEAGWKRVCPACRAEHFPRVDPVVIMLPTLGDRCLLGRQGRFPPGMFSALAGFVEPGETLEEACARETLEEVGLTVIATTIHSSQPWPFPASLMIGMICTVDGEEVRLDDEITEVVWLTKAQARAALAGGVDLESGRVWAPPPFAIAHQLLKSWAET